ncbi:MAG: hypothetical protein ABEJ24_01140 [Candidatus Magasanikbacteria bacterium]
MPRESRGEKFYHEKTKGEDTKRAIEATKELNKFEGDIENKPKKQISEWLDRLEQIWLGENVDKEKMERMKQALYDKYVIDMEEITKESSHFENETRIAIEEGREADLRRAGVEFEKEYDDEGNLHVDIEHIPEDKKQELAETVIDDQKESLDQWVDYFTSEDSDSFPMWAKYWAFTGMTKLGTYDKETNTFDKRSKGTVAPFPDLNREALALAVDYMVNKYSEEYLDLEEKIREQENKLDRLDSYGRLKGKINEKKDELPEQAIEGMKRNLESYQEEFGEDIDFDEKEQKLKQELQQLKDKEEEVLSTERLSEEEQEIFSTESFAKMYAKALEKTVPTEEKELQRTEGSWVKFPQGSDPEEYIPEDFDKSLLESIQGKGTGWCTAGKNTAQKQLEGGDFYVYYSENEEGEEEIPRVAIRMERDEIAEVRGVDKRQHLDPYIAEELNEKLDDVEGIDEGEIEIYKKKAEDMEKLSEIAQKHHSGQALTKEDLDFLFEINEDIRSFGARQDPRVYELRRALSLKDEFADWAVSLVKRGEENKVVSIILRRSRFNNQNSVIARKMVESGEASFVARYLTYFEEIDADTAINIALETEYRDKLIRNINLVKEKSSFTSVAKILIEQAQERYGSSKALKKLNEIINKLNKQKEGRIKPNDLEFLRSLEKPLTFEDESYSKLDPVAERVIKEAEIDKKFNYFERLLDVLERNNKSDGFSKYDLSLIYGINLRDKKPDHSSEIIKGIERRIINSVNEKDLELESTELENLKLNKMKDLLERKVKGIRETRDNKEDLVEILNCSPKEISKNQHKSLKEDILCHFGRIDLNHKDINVENMKSKKEILDFFGGPNLPNMETPEGIEVLEDFPNKSVVGKKVDIEFPDYLIGNLYIEGIIDADIIKDIEWPKQVTGKIHLSHCSVEVKKFLNKKFSEDKVKSGTYY